MSFAISITDECNGCGLCIELCPLNCLSLGQDKKPYLEFNECWYCGVCEIHCPISCLKIGFPTLI